MQILVSQPLQLMFALGLIYYYFSKGQILMKLTFSQILLFFMLSFSATADFLSWADYLLKYGLDFLQD